VARFVLPNSLQAGLTNMAIRRGFFVLVLLVVTFATAAPAKQTKRKASTVRPVQMYSLSSCDKCATLKSFLRGRGVHLDVTQVSEKYMNLYPIVFYSDDSYDYGNRIYAGRCRLPRSLEVIETN
jgi:hypothetical protein